jgi:micrococcal nuclease
VLQRCSVVELDLNAEMTLLEVQLELGKLLNETLVREGYAFVTTYPPNVRYVDRFRAAQREARSAGRGVWGRCVQEGACDPAYPDACIPPPPPDLDCSDIDERRVTVLPPDPHNFDGDHNGVGCEMP